MPLWSQSRNLTKLLPRPRRRSPNITKFYAERGDPSLLNARFFGITCRKYYVFSIVRDGATIGYVALRVMDMRGFLAIGIVDILFDFSRRDVARAVFRAMDRFAIEQNADLVSILTNSPPLIAQLAVTPQDT